MSIHCTHVVVVVERKTKLCEFVYDTLLVGINKS